MNEVADSWLMVWRVSVCMPVVCVYVCVCSPRLAGGLQQHVGLLVVTRMQRCGAYTPSGPQYDTGGRGLHPIGCGAPFATPKSTCRCAHLVRQMYYAFHSECLCPSSPICADLVPGLVRGSKTREEVVKGGGVSHGQQVSISVITSGQWVVVSISTLLHCVGAVGCCIFHYTTTPQRSTG